MNIPYPLTHQFDDFEAFTEAVSGYDLEAQQLERGLFSATSQQIVSGRVLLSHLTSTRCVEMRGSPPPKVRSFGIPTETCQPFIWRNQYSDGNTIQLYRDVTELEIVTQPFFAAIDLSIPEDILNQQCQTLGLPELDDILGDNEMLTCDPDRMRPLRDTLRRVCRILSDDASRINTVSMRREIEDELPLLLLNALYSGKSQQGYVHPRKRQRALKKAVHYIRAFSKNSITLNQLCQEAQVSARTLQHAFLDQYSLTPKAYLRVQRLNEAHKKLVTLSPLNTGVADIAHLSGFNHMGQFATDYRKLFGELPSATLQRSGH